MANDTPEEPMTPAAAEDWLRALGETYPGADVPDVLVPYDLEADARILWPNFPHEHLEVGDTIELKQDGRPYKTVRVTKVIPGPGGQVMYEWEPAAQPDNATTEG